MSSRLPIYVGAVRPRMTRLAGEIGDGILLEMEALRHELPARLVQFRAGAREAGRDPDTLEVVKLVLTSVTGRGEPLHPNALGWATKSAALVDDATVTTLGWDLERVGHIRSTWAARDWDTGKGLMTPDMIRTFVAAGPPEDCLRVVEETVQSGVTLPVLVPYGGDLRPVLELGATYAAG
jgi:5,10-methylenetetrahydromethanopterin reductase